MSGNKVSANRQLLEKIIAMQDKIMPTLDSFEAKGELPADLRKAKENIQMWDAEVEKEDGHDKGYREWPPKKFAKELHKHISMFDDHTIKDLIREYNELVGKLDYDFDREHV